MDGVVETPTVDCHPIHSTWLVQFPPVDGEPHGERSKVAFFRLSLSRPCEKRLSYQALPYKLQPQA